MFCSRYLADLVHVHRRPELQRGRPQGGAGPGAAALGDSIVDNTNSHTICYMYDR